jgi:hypothetical protein
MGPVDYELMYHLYHLLLEWSAAPAHVDHRQWVITIDG